ncbi:MAG: SDR family oxidoreductase [Thiohalocapsa sp.]|nr:SDR family oxidoreductase [Thiohalocapsa sp.]
MAKQFLIIGAGSGIGAELLSALAERGDEVLHMSRNPDAAADRPGVRGVRWDAVAEPFPADALPERIDGLAYCPGSIRLKPFHRLGDDEFLEDLQLNLLGAVRAIRGALSPLKRSENGAIVLFSTVAVQLGMPYHASVAAAKGAVEGLTRALAAELAPAVRVNAIAPTLTDTPLARRLLSSEEKRAAAAARHPLGRIADASEMAQTAAWLLRDARSVTGQVITADAGLARLRLM